MVHKRDLNKSQVAILVVILWLAYSFYFITSAGINTSNDSGHFALAKSIYLEQNVTIGEYNETYIRRPDYAIKDSVMYSDRLFGTALLTIPFLAYVDAALYVGLINPLTEAIGITHPEGHPDTHVLGAILLSNICGMIGVFLFFYLCFSIFSFSFSSSILATSIFAFATLVQLESTHLFSHAPSMMLVTLAVVVCLNKHILSINKSILCAAILGLSTLLELQNFLYAGPVFLYLLSADKSFRQQWSWSNFKLFALGVTIIGAFIGLLVLYNYFTFDEIMLKSNKYNPFFPEELSFVTSLSGNVFDGLDRLFTSFHNVKSYIDWDMAVQNDTPGLFVANPISLLSMFGFYLFYKKFREEFYLFVSIIAISVIIPAMHVTTLTRHMFTSHALIIFPLVFVIDWARSQSRPKSIAIFSVIGIFALLSFARELHISSNYWGKGGYGVFPFLNIYHYFLLLNIPLILSGLAIIFLKYRTRIRT